MAKATAAAREFEINENQPNSFAQSTAELEETSQDNNVHIKERSKDVPLLLIPHRFKQCL